MKKLLFLITVMSLSFSQGTVYLGLEQTPEWDDGNGANDMDAGGMVLGYNHPVHMSEDGKYVLSFGTSMNYLYHTPAHTSKQNNTLQPPPFGWATM